MISDSCMLGKENVKLGKENVYRLGPCDQKRRAEYQQRTAEILGIDFPVEYYNRAVILTLIDQLGQMCGGAIVVQQLPFRSLLSIPDQAENGRNPHLEMVDDLAEINGVWLSPDVKTPILPVTFWRQMIAFLLTTEKQRFLFTFDRNNKQMGKLAAWLRYEVLYSGPTHQLAGMKQPSHETIAVLHRDSFISLNDTLNRLEGSAVPSYEGPNDLLTQR